MSHVVMGHTGQNFQPTDNNSKPTVSIFLPELLYVAMMRVILKVVVMVVMVMTVFNVR